MGLTPSTGPSPSQGVPVLVTEDDLEAATAALNDAPSA